MTRHNKQLLGSELPSKFSLYEKEHSMKYPKTASSRENNAYADSLTEGMYTVLFLRLKLDLEVRTCTLHC